MEARVSGSMPSDMRVKPEISAKSTEISQRRAWRMGASRFWAALRISLTTWGLW